MLQAEPILLAKAILMVQVMFLLDLQEQGEGQENKLVLLKHLLELGEG